MKKNVVILSTMYYPDMGAPSACIDKYVQALKTKYNFYIITKTYKMSDEFIHKDNVTYISCLRHKLILRCKHNINSGNHIILSRLLFKLIDAYKLIATQFCNPTANSWENRAYYKELKKLSKINKIDTVISVSNTAFCQFAARKFKKANEDVKWITFILDPFAENYIYYRYKILKKYWKHKNLKNEEDFFRSSDYTLLSEDMYRFAMGNFNMNPSTTYCIRFTLNNLRTCFPKTIDSVDRYKLIYAGALYQKIRNPEFMLSVIAQVPNSYLDLFVDSGECDGIIENYVSDYITRQAFAPKDRYNEMICDEYDFLVNIGNISQLQSPSKMLDLLSTGRPIINFYFVKDSQYEMIEKYPLGINVGFQEEGAVEKVSAFCSEMKGKVLSFSEVSGLFPENDQSKQVLLLDSLIMS